MSPILCFFALLHTRHSSPLLFLSAKLERKRTVDHATVSPALKASRRTVFRSPPLSLSLSAPAFRHSDKPKVRFLSLSSLQTSRGGLLLAESALFTFLSLLFAADSGARWGAIAFFSLSLRVLPPRSPSFFVLFLSSSHQARVLRLQQSLSADADPLSSYILALLLDASTVGTRAEDLSPFDGDPGSTFSTTHCPRRGGFLLAESALFTLLSLLFAADSGARQLAIAFFFLSTRFATSLTFVFRSFPQLLASSASSPAPAEPFRRRRPTLQQHPRPAPRREHRRHLSGRSFTVDGGIPAAVLKQALYDSKGTSPRSTRPLPSSRRRRRSTPYRQGHRQASSVEHSPNGHPRTKSPLPSLQVRVQGELYSTDGQAVVSSRRNCDIEEQETGVGLAPKLPQIVPITTTPAVGKRLILRLRSSCAERHLLYALAAVPSACTADISVKFKPPRAR